MYEDFWYADRRLRAIQAECKQADMQRPLAFLLLVLRKLLYGVSKCHLWTSVFRQTETASAGMLVVSMRSVSRYDETTR